MTYQAVFFDFDYTLGDATDAILAGFSHGMTQLGQPVPDRETIRGTVGLPLEAAYERLTGDQDPKRQSQFREAFASVARPMQLQGVPLFPGGAELLHALHRAGVHLAIASTKQQSTLETILNAQGLLDLLDFVIGGDSVAHTKPAPDCLLLGMERLHLRPKELLFCGDTTIDAATAQAAGCDFAAVLNGTTPKEAFEPYPKVFVAPDLPALQAFLGL